MAAFGIDRSVGQKGDSFALEESSFSFHRFPVSFSAESTDGEVAFYNAVARGAGGKWIAAQGLTDCLWGSAGDVVTQ